jgi:hypothetical protein
MCSYAPRADQEHMHNRVAFTTGDWEYANMDGYERLIAFRTGDDFDLAVGQVESDRLRWQPKLPQDVQWNPKGPYRRLEQPMVYRRTIVFVKRPAGGKGLDYFVIRNEHEGPNLRATYCLHVESPDCKPQGQTIDFGTMTLFCARPAHAKFERFDWEFEKSKGGYSESTSGARLSTSGKRTQFITALYPSGKPPRMDAIPEGVRLIFDGGKTDEVTFGDPESARAGRTIKLKRDGKTIIVLTPSDIDLNRSQGEVGLFIPECGYDFGPIPDWLIQQRDAKIRARFMEAGD